MKNLPFQIYSLLGRMDIKLNGKLLYHKKNILINNFWVTNKNLSPILTTYLLLIQSHNRYRLTIRLILQRVKKVFEGFSFAIRITGAPAYWKYFLNRFLAMTKHLALPTVFSLFHVQIWSDIILYLSFKHKKEMGFRKMRFRRLLCRGRSK